MKTFYYTNQLSDRHEARVIETQIEKSTGLILDNPFYLADGTPTKEIEQLDNGQEVTVTDAEIVAVDLKKIKESDGIVAYMKSYSLGSPMEIFYCHEILGKPVYVVCVNERMRQHPWLKFCTNRIFDNARDFIKFVNEELNVNDQQAA